MSVGSAAGAFFRSKKLWLLPPLIIGGLAIALAPMIKSKPPQTAAAERAAKVRAIKLTPIDVVPRAAGYGSVMPTQVWDAVAEVAGQVEWVAPELKNGSRIAAGTPLLRIEDANYRLVLAQLDAQLKASDVKDETTRASLAIAERDLKLLQQDYERKKQLVERGATAAASAEATERQMLSGQSQVQTLRNSLDINAAEKQVLIAQREAAALDLARTEIVAPFDVRITNVDIGEAQYANKGQLLFTADGLAAAEVDAQFPIGMLHPLVSAATGKDDAMTSQQVLGDLAAVVSLGTATRSVSWPAAIQRTSGIIDPQTQSVGVVVTVDDPDGQAEAGKRPRLLRNTFVKVELTAPAMAKQIVVPRNALHDGAVYVVDAESRLEVREVKTAFAQGGFAVVAEGLSEGDRIVTSDLPSAVKGMLLEPQEDKKTKRNLVTEASGQEPSQ